MGPRDPIFHVLAVVLLFLNWAAFLFFDLSFERAVTGLLVIIGLAVLNLDRT